jgi:hypothetical protein
LFLSSEEKLIFVPAEAAPTDMGIGLEALVVPTPPWAWTLETPAERAAAVNNETSNSLFVFMRLHFVILQTRRETLPLRQRTFHNTTKLLIISKPDNPPLLSAGSQNRVFYTGVFSGGF